MKLMRNLLCASTLILASCTTIETHLPQGPQGAEGKQGLSAFEFWVESVNKGEVQWDKNAVTVADFFKYLKGKDGATGTSAYDQWKKEIESGNVENPHKKGEKWSANRNSVQDFFYFITGATGEKGEQGPQGERGEQGIQGPQGEQGQPGTNGRDGADGRDGTDGRDGAPGRDGTNGTNGTDGTNGTNGTDGTNGLSAYELWKATAETGSLDNPHKEGEKWDKAKVSESDFWEYLRGADAVSPTITEKGVTPLEITKEEEGEGVKWVVEVTTTPNSTVTFSNGKTKKTAVANEQGVATVELDRDTKRDLHFVVNVTAEGKIQSETLIVSVPKAEISFNAVYPNSTQIKPNFTEEEKEFIAELAPISNNPYSESNKKLDVWFMSNNEVVIPFDFKNATNIEFVNNDLTAESIVVDKEAKTVTLSRLTTNGTGVSTTVKEERKPEHAEVWSLYKKETKVGFRVTYIDGTTKYSDEIPVTIWSLSQEQEVWE